MPLGDSITYGVGDPDNGGCRGPLYAQLANSACTIDFVGSLATGRIPDPEHEGHFGWRADQIANNIGRWLTACPADIILLHIGTNDIDQGKLAPAITSDVEQILNNIDVYEQQTQIGRRLVRRGRTTPA